MYVSLFMYLFIPALSAGKWWQHHGFELNSKPNQTSNNPTHDAFHGSPEKKKEKLSNFSASVRKVCPGRKDDGVAQGDRTL